MNYLAHAYLSGDNNELLVGNFIADGIRGNKILHLPSGVQAGIMLHRAIDTFTDTHPVNAEMRKLFYPTAGKYAGVVLDIFYDYLLANNWQKFSSERLEDFVDRCYQLIEDNVSLLPDKTAYMFPYMRQFNWLLNYRMEEGIMKSLQGLSKRIVNEPKLGAAGELAFKQKDLIQEAFLTFFPELVIHCNKISGQDLTFTL